MPAFGFEARIAKRRGCRRPRPARWRVALARRSLTNHLWTRASLRWLAGPTLARFGGLDQGLGGDLGAPGVGGFDGRIGRCRGSTGRPPVATGLAAGPRAAFGPASDAKAFERRLNGPQADLIATLGKTAFDFSAWLPAIIARRFETPSR